MVLYLFLFQFPFLMLSKGTQTTAGGQSPASLCPSCCSSFYSFFLCLLFILSSVLLVTVKTGQPQWRQTFILHDHQASPTHTQAYHMRPRASHALVVLQTSGWGGGVGLLLGFTGAIVNVAVNVILIRIRKLNSRNRTEGLYFTSIGESAPSLLGNHIFIFYKKKLNVKDIKKS